MGKIVVEFVLYFLALGTAGILGFLGAKIKDKEKQDLNTQLVNNENRSPKFNDCDEKGKDYYESSLSEYLKEKEENYIRRKWKSLSKDIKNQKGKYISYVTLRDQNRNKTTIAFLSHEIDQMEYELTHSFEQDFISGYRIQSLQKQAYKIYPENLIQYSDDEKRWVDDLIDRDHGAIDWKVSYYSIRKSDISSTNTQKLGDEIINSMSIELINS